ncbi:hypothetical protein BLJAPNOD_06265 [Ensifer sp. M14]|nr:hypothetical protein BLJAPNOD_06265 [Ensifer sp. M14]
MRVLAIALNPIGDISGQAARISSTSKIPIRHARQRRSAGGNIASAIAKRGGRPKLISLAGGERRGSRTAIPACRRRSGRNGDGRRTVQVGAVLAGCWGGLLPGSQLPAGLLTCDKAVGSFESYYVNSTRTRMRIADEPLPRPYAQRHCTRSPQERSRCRHADIRSERRRPVSEPRV